MNRALILALLSLHLALVACGNAPKSMAGTSWRLERVVILSAEPAPGSTKVTRNPVGDSMPGMKLVFGSGAGPRLTGTVISVGPSARQTQTWEVTAVETPDRQITVNLPAEIGVLNEAASLSGSIGKEALVLLGDRSEEQGYLDSLVFVRLGREMPESTFALVMRGDSAVAARTMLKNHVRDVLDAENSYFGNHTEYTADVRRLRTLVIPPNVKTSVTLLPGTSGFLTTVYVTARHGSGLTCYVYVGSPSPMNDHEEGRPWCR